MCIPGLYALGFTGESSDLAARIVSAQNSDGSWPYGEFSDRSTVNSQTDIISSLISYQRLAGGSDVGEAIVSGSRWLSGQQNSEGRFWNFVVPTTGRVIKTEQVSYPRAMEAYKFSGLDGQYELTRAYLEASYDPGRDDLEALVEIMGWGV